MRKKYDYVIVGLQPWYTSIGSNCKNIAAELSKTNRVLYINAPLDRRTILKRKNDTNIAHHYEVTRGKRSPVEQIGPNFWVYSPESILESLNWIPLTPVFERFNLINNRRFAHDIEKAVKAVGFGEYILFNDNELFRTFYLKKLLKPALYIYYCRDYLRSIDYWQKHGDTVEPKHIRLADVATANSLYLYEYLRKHNRNSYYIGQGCDTALFDGKKTYARPADMQKISRPVIGYVGVLTSLRLDVDCIVKIAKTCKAYDVVLVGPEDEVFEQSELHKLPNVHFLGKKPLSELPAYMKAFDVCINPQLVNELTIGNYPLKIDEYLNMGKPVVATKTLTMELFKDHVYLAKTPDEYPGMIREALETDTAEKQQARIGFASQHTWENSVQELYKAIETTLGETNQNPSAVFSNT
ncbi:MAG: glycosyltransferase [Mucilaginibacter polytrichastri]|nr:glycosyltransferase [Mucilaginibacter polytrichastri]